MVISVKYKSMKFNSHHPFFVNKYFILLQFSLSKLHPVFPHFCEQTGKQEFRHSPVLRNQCREIRSARLIHLSRYVI